MAELVRERESSPHIGLAATHVHLESGAAGLGLSHRGVRATQQAFGIDGVVRSHRDADRHSGFEVQAVNGEARRHGGDELVAERAQVVEGDRERR